MVKFFDSFLMIVTFLMALEHFKGRLKASVNDTY